MAIELLLEKPGIRHTPQHDLESLFFVLVYLCTNLSGPGAIRTQDELQLHSTIPLSAWFKVSSTLHQIGIHKIGTLCTLESNILNRFAPYFDELKPCVRHLFKAIYGNRFPGTPSNVSHDEIIQIFTDTLDSLAPEVALPNTYRPLLASSPRTRKHSLGIHDNYLGKWNQKKRKTSSIENGVASSVSGNNIWIAVSGEEILSRSASRGRRGRHASASRSGRAARSR
jgi:hypothetical protein